MNPMKLALVAMLLLAGCGGSDNPFLGEDDPTPDGEGPPGVVGTENPAASRALVRREVKVTTPGPEYGNGFAELYQYNAATDTFAVDGLAFDGGNVYTRDDVQPSLGPFQVYEGASTYNDNQTGRPIGQLLYRAVQGVSANGNGRFAIVRTGSYVPYGFGGFLLERTGGFTMPEDLPNGNQGLYTGQYAGLRDFAGSGGLEYVSGSAAVAIDFDDFNDATNVIGNGVQGQVTGRRIFAPDGTELTGGILAALNAQNPDPTTHETEIPVLRFKIGPGVMSVTGEIAGEVDSNYFDGTRDRVFENGKYYAIISDVGDREAAEIVGIVVVTAEDPRQIGVTVRETGGFIVYR